MNRLVEVVAAQDLGLIEPDVMAIRTASGSTRRRDARVVVARGRAIAGRAVRPVTMIGRTLALVTERVDPNQQRRSLEAGAVSELQGIARFKMPSVHLLSMSDLASRGSIAPR